MRANDSSNGIARGAAARPAASAARCETARHAAAPAHRPAAHPFARPALLAAVCLAACLAFCLAGCAPAPDGGASGGAASASTSASTGTSSGALTVRTVNEGKSKAHKHEVVRVSAHGKGFSDASRVTVEVLNASDPKAAPVAHEAQAGKHGTWEAQVEPAVVGTGVWHVAARALDANGQELAFSEASFTYCATFELSNDVVLTGGDYDLVRGTSGLKVLRVQNVVGVGLDRYPRYLDATMEAVRSFQAGHGLPETGVVDKQTWLAMGLDPIEWHALGAYVSPATVGRHASSSQRVEAMVARAYEYLGDLYEWDASGAPGQGVDCAGLVIQALYAAGCDTGIVNPVTHSTTTWGDQDALNMYAYCNLKEVDPARPKRGDLVFYSLSGSGTVDHVAIYLGDGQIIEAHPKGVRVSQVDYAPVVGVRRVFG